MKFADLMPFEAALQTLTKRKAAPTDKSFAELQAMGPEFHRENFTSSRTLLADLLDQYKASVEKIINPVTVTTTAGTQKTEGLDIPTARLQAKELLKSLGYSPDPKDAGTIKDLSSDRRINLVIETNRDVHQGFGFFIQGNNQDVLDAFPAKELVRIQERKQHRDWRARWLLAARLSGDTDAIRLLETTGRMMARKDSPIWLALGDRENFADGLGNPFAPYALQSGMGERDIAYKIAVALGLMERGGQVQPAQVKFPTINLN